MQKQYIDKINQGLFDMIQETKATKQSLIRRAKVLDALSVLVKSTRLHTQRRLTGKLNTTPDKTVDKIFDKFREAVEVIK